MFGFLKVCRVLGVEVLKIFKCLYSGLLEFLSSKVQCIPKVG